MAVYDIAGLKVNIVEPSGRTEKQARPYLSDNQDENQHIDITVNVSRENIEHSAQVRPELNEDDWEYMISGNQFYKKLLDFKGIMLHYCCR